MDSIDTVKILTEMVQAYVGLRTYSDSGLITTDRKDPGVQFSTLFRRPHLLSQVKTIKNDATAAFWGDGISFSERDFQGNISHFGSSVPNFEQCFESSHWLPAKFLLSLLMPGTPHFYLDLTGMIDCLPEEYREYWAPANFQNVGVIEIGGEDCYRLQRETVNDVLTYEVELSISKERKILRRIVITTTTGIKELCAAFGQSRALEAFGITGEIDGQLADEFAKLDTRIYERFEIFFSTVELNVAVEKSDLPSALNTPPKLAKIQAYDLPEATNFSERAKELHDLYLKNIREHPVT